MQQVSPESAGGRRCRQGWTDITFGWKLDLDWSQVLPAVESQIESDGYTMFGAFFMMMVFKGVLVSMAGPAPNYDMQRILAARSAKEAAMMSGFVTVVLVLAALFHGRGHHGAGAGAAARSGARERQARRRTSFCRW